MAGMGGKQTLPRVMNVDMARPQPTSNDFERIVVRCVAYASGADASRVSSETDLVFGLGIGGDDGVDLIAAVREATGAQLSGYDFYQHFGPEAAFTTHKPRPLTVRQLTQLVEAELATR